MNLQHLQFCLQYEPGSTNEVDVLSRQSLLEIDVTEKTDSVFAMAGQTISETSQGVDLVAVWAAIAHNEALISAKIFVKW